jgi:FlaA1/EpsC-like NDP-sugar epimerase
VTSPFARRLTRVLWDWLSWALATVFVVGSRYDFELKGVLWAGVAIYTFTACVLQALLGTVGMLYRGRYRIATLEESVGLATTTGLVGALLAVAFLGFTGGNTLPRAIAVLTPPVALLVMAGGRVAFRAWRDRSAPNLDAEKVLIYGAGNAGYQLVRLLTTEPASSFQVVGFIDDAKSKRNLRLLGTPVLGPHKRLLELAGAYGVTTVILSIPNASSALVREISDTVESAGIRLLVVPPVHELIGGRVRLSDIREVDFGDLLGRHQVATNVHEIAGYLTDRIVMVTGAGGSIGSELARQIYQYGPRELVLLDRDESALHAVQLSIYGQGLLDTPDIVLADIRDQERLDVVFAQHRPEVTFHAAALKHLPMLEQYPSEGWKTNVDGTLNVLRVAERYGCTRFVNISTDKAADPISVLGSTKRLAERLTAWYAGHSGQVYLSVRFGNVLGSRGSVLETFTQQIAAGGPVTVTHPDICRFFMTIPEACELTIQAAAIGDPGEVLVLDMGEPVRILDVAKRLVARAGRDVEIVFTGLRQGEKLNEVLVSEDEVGVIKQHPLINHVPVPPLDPDELALTADSDPARVRPPIQLVTG